MKELVFEYTEYKAFLRSWIDSRPHNGHGEKSRIARAAQCHLAYVSQVLSGSSHFSSEQLVAVSEYIGLPEAEMEFLLLLLAQERAGSQSLRRFYAKKIRFILESRNLLKNLLNFQKSLGPEAQIRYYSAWYYIATHMLVTMPEFQSRASLEKRLNLPTEKVSAILQFLIDSGLVALKSGKYISGPLSIHLGNDSAMISKHHVNWRMKAIQSLECEKNEDLHYSSTITIARADIPKVRKLILRAIEDIRKVVRESKEDSLYCYCFDLFEI